MKIEKASVPPLSIVCSVAGLTRRLPASLPRGDGKENVIGPGGRGYKAGAALVIADPGDPEEIGKGDEVGGRNPVVTRSRHELPCARRAQVANVVHPLTDPFTVRLCDTSVPSRTWFSGPAACLPGAPGRRADQAGG